jgi:hypothetical protein
MIADEGFPDRPDLGIVPPVGGLIVVAVAAQDEEQAALTAPLV